MLLFFETPCLVAAVRRCMEWIPIKKSSTCWLIVGPYQSILAKAIKTGFIAARRKYLSIYFVLSSSDWKNSSRKKYIFEESHAEVVQNFAWVFKSATYSLGKIFWSWDKFPIPPLSNGPDELFSACDKTKLFDEIFFENCNLNN